MPIYIAFHKDYPLLSNDPVYSPLHVGRALAEKKRDMPGDDVGDNISAKNASYCELTGMYWIWKNTESDYVGMGHYSRYFMFKQPSAHMKWGRIKRLLMGHRKRYSWMYYGSNSNATKLILTGDEAQELLSVYDAIIPIPLSINQNVWDEYCRRHFKRDFQITRDVVTEKYPDYTDAFDEIMKKEAFHSCNMLVMKRPYFDAYAQWLFDVLFEVEARTDISGYDSYQKRIYGFISERLFNVWLAKNKLNTVQLPVIHFKYLKV